MKKKTIALLTACVLLLGCVVGGTVAWLLDQTDAVQNTFTASNIAIELTETQPADKTAKMVPGHTIEKDPKVKVQTGSEFCWLFVKIEESSTLDSYISYTVADDWTAGNGEGEGKNGVPEGVWFREIDDASKIGVAYSVLTDDQVTVKDTVTKDDMEKLNATGAVQPTLTFTAYASQLMKDNDTEFSAAEAWKNINPATP